MKKVILAALIALAFMLGIGTVPRPAKADGGPLILCPPKNCRVTCRCDTAR